MAPCKLSGKEAAIIHNPSGPMPEVSNPFVRAARKTLGPLARCFSGVLISTPSHPLVRRFDLCTDGGSCGEIQ